MRKRLIHFVIFALFGGSVGHFVFCLYGPIGGWDYVADGEWEFLRGPEPRSKNLYLRHNLYLPQRPRAGWIRLLGYDILELYVNGELLEQQEHDDYPTAIVADLTPHLREGKNVLGVVSRQATLYHPPLVAVEGGYTLDDGEHPFGSAELWRYSEHFERGDDYWFTLSYDDSGWPLPVRERRRVRVPLTIPTPAITSPNRGSWISPQDPTVTHFSVRRNFEVRERLEYAFLRLQCTAPYRLAVNGRVLESREDQLGTTVSVPPMQWVYDLTPFLRRGANTVSLAVTTEVPPARLRADLEVKGRSGGSAPYASDAQWLWRPGSGADGCTSVRESAAWHACAVEAGDQGLQPWESGLQVVGDLMPTEFSVRLWAWRGGTMLVTALVAWVVTGLVDRRLSAATRGARRGGVSPSVLALVPATLFLLTAILLVDDPRMAAQDVYRPLWLLVALGLVVLQWIWLGMVCRRAVTEVRPLTKPVPWLPRPGLVAAVWVVVFAGGACLRFRDIAARPLSPDEVSMYRATMGFLDRGFPSIVIHPDIPPVYAATSELVYCGTALAGLVFDDDRLVVRTPAAIWGTITIFLMFWVGKKLFRSWVGLIAAALYAFSPFCIGMADLGRYYSQLQAMALLTVYHFYRTIEPDGPINRRAMWLTVLCFNIMFLSWEGSALLAVPLMVVAVIYRRDSIRSLLCEPAIWQGLFVVGLVVLGQSAHRNLVQIGRPLFGSGASDVAMTPMWRYPGFDLWYYVQSATWNRDTLLPTLGLWGGGLLAIRHPFCKPARALLMIFLGTAIFQAMVLPVTGSRYSYHLLPLWVLLAAAVVVAVGRGLSWVRSAAAQPWGSAYGRSLAGLTVTVYVVLGCGLVADLEDMAFWRTGGSSLTALKLPGQEPSVQYVLDHWEPGDVVIVNGPHVIDHYLKRDSDFWLQTEMRLQATMDDQRPVPLHRLKGAVMLRDLNHVEDAFTRYKRIWFITEPAFNSRTNLDDTNRFLRGHMEVVFEDYSSLVLLRDDQHRPVAVQRRDNASLDKSGASFLD